ENIALIDLVETDHYKKQLKTTIRIMFFAMVIAWLYSILLIAKINTVVIETYINDQMEVN
ncbi:hypothetical protein, partial [Salmonella sp. s54925]|uniref:hypothetical protein n=1 Tax=Salmonella sp. s54925 TaxID=3159674 RepID=UPI0039802EF9